MSLAPCIGRPAAAHHHLSRPSSLDTSPSTTPLAAASSSSRPLAPSARGVLGSRQHVRYNSSSSSSPAIMLRSLLLLSSRNSSSSKTFRLATAAASGASTQPTLLSSCVWNQQQHQQRRGAWRTMASLRGGAAAGGDARQPLGEVTNQRAAAYSGSTAKPHAAGGKGVPLSPPRAAPASGTGSDVAAPAAAAAAAAAATAASGDAAAATPRPSSSGPGGAIELIVGPMFAGKTTRLLQRVAECEAQGLRVALVKSGKDTRYSASEVVSHDGARRVCHAVESLAAFHALAPRPWWYDVDVIAIDEAQFFPDLAEFARTAADRHGKRVIAAGLDGDYKRRRFGQVLDLVPCADSVVKLAAHCAYCDAPALFSLRIVADERQEVVGGADKYAPVCRHHYVSLSSLREFSGASSSAAGDDGDDACNDTDTEDEGEEAARLGSGSGNSDGGSGTGSGNDENAVGGDELHPEQQQHGRT